MEAILMVEASLVAENLHDEGCERKYREFAASVAIS
jgi:hypothetical protein